MTKKLTNPLYGFNFPKYYLQKKGKLTIIGHVFHPDYTRPKRRLIGVCDCGSFTEVGVAVFVREEKLSCGCWAKTRQSLVGKFNFKHGHSHTTDLKNTPIYSAWSKIKGCCTSGWRKGFHVVCHEYDKKWQDFAGFFEDFGHIQKNQTISRIDNKKPWAKENCFIKQR